MFVDKSEGEEIDKKLAEIIEKNSFPVLTTDF